MSRRDDSRRSQRGVALVEFAIVLPFLIVLLFSVWELGRIFDAWLVVTNGAREGARYAVATSDDAVVRTKVEDYIVSGYGLTRITSGDIRSYTIDVDRPASTGMVTVTVKATVQIFAPLPEVGSLRNPFTVTGYAVMRQ